MRIKYSRDSLKFLAKLDAKSVNRIRDAIHGLTLDPPVGDIKVMQGYTDNRRRLRVGGWRVIYKYDNEGKILILFVIDIGNRGDIYTNLNLNICQIASGFFVMARRRFAGLLAASQGPTKSWRKRHRKMVKV